MNMSDFELPIFCARGYTGGMTPQFYSRFQTQSGLVLICELQSCVPTKLRFLFVDMVPFGFKKQPQFVDGLDDKTETAAIRWITVVVAWF